MKKTDNFVKINLMPFQKHQLVLIGFLLVLFLALVLFTLAPFLKTIFFALILAIICRPIYKFILRYVKFRGLASLITIFVILMAVLGPLTALSYAVFIQAKELYVSIANNDTALPAINTWFKNLDKKIEELVPGWSFTFNFKDFFINSLNWLVKNLGSFFSGLASGVAMFILSLFITFYLLQEGDSLKNFIAINSPLAPIYLELIFSKIKDSVNSVMRGSLLVALIQGGISGVGFLIFGIPNAALWSGFATISSLIPSIGTTLIFLPVILYSLLTKNLITTIGLAVWGLVLVGLSDNLVKPILMKKKIGFHPLIIFLSVVGGLLTFGPIGFIIGPIIFTIFFALLEIYFLALKNKN